MVPTSPLSPLIVFNGPQGVNATETDSMDRPGPYELPGIAPVYRIC